ncbi:hypothetical protein ZIOFF_074674 [Zingiber officinale]|uniref:C2H2-type domain-containing protein n=1 Tax=Zingiber officinale TaxID=94328 RepID=A0A8J5BWD7_ZINOF|nr:hypothetical protein ZIOFF_074674 [Zingiber officinale]
MERQGSSGEDERQQRRKERGKVLELELLGKLGAIKAEPVSPEPAPRVFSCKYCPKTYSSPQALGGHQNAHRRERNFAMRGAATEFLQYAGRRLDVPVRSVIHMPYLGAPATSAAACRWAVVQAPQRIFAVQLCSVERSAGTSGAGC